MDSEKVGKKLHIYYYDDLDYTVLAVPRTDRLDFEIYKNVQTDTVEEKGAPDRYVKKKDRKYQAPQGLVSIEDITKATASIVGFVKSDGSSRITFHQTGFEFTSKGHAKSLGQLLERVVEIQEVLVK
ncbi:MAG: hypothetical protein R3213_13405 [Flavobacteriaceae bacterium]|nr:hypothetical protein [Flavobacteriaceae bacterium]